MRDGAVETIEALDSLQPAFDPDEGLDAVALDIPLGHEHPDGEGPGLRACDRAARELLGEARERVFRMLPHALLEAEDYNEVARVCDEKGWPRLEVPLWHARKRLQRAREAAGDDERLLEVHPEVSYTVLGEKVGRSGPMERYSETWAAIEERLSALNEAGVHPEGLLEDVRDRDPRAALDAVVAAWSADRALADAAACLPEDPPEDPGTGREVALYA